MAFVVSYFLMTHFLLTLIVLRRITSSDFTIVVQDPPADAYDPDEWHAFFSQFAAKQVTAITIALNNETLLRKLIDRRRHRQNLKLMLPKGTNMNDVDELHIAVAQLVRDRIQEGKSWLTSLLDVTILPILRIFNMFLPPETLLEKSLTLTDEIKELTKNDYTVTKVFVTYETEEGQRAAMESLSVGKLVVLMNQTSMLPPSALFRGKVLTVTETAEANAIRWLDLSASNMRILIMRIITLLSTGGVLGICGLVVYRVRYGFGTTLAAPLVSVFNFLIPLIVKIFMLFEPHHTEGNFQASLYTKITMFRWVNTALLAKLVTPWTSTVGPNRSDM